MAYPPSSAAVRTDRKSPAQDTAAPPERHDDEILEELRERRDYAQKAWANIRTEGQKDVMCVAGDVWEAMDPDGLSRRHDAKRPAMSCDEIGQYLNQTGNDVRQNKRGVKVTPTGNGANDKTAAFRQARIRQIEYESNAQRDVYSPVFEDALQRSYGFGRIVSMPVNPLSKKLKLRLEAFPNPDVVLVDPDGAMLSPDCAKIQWAFILDASRKRKSFTREFPDAEVTDFDAGENVAPDWIRGDSITLAEYWLIEPHQRRVVFLKIDPDRGFLASKLPRVPRDEEIAGEEMREFPYVCQYLTNGLELLAKPGKAKRTPWPGPSIPLFSCFGKVLYVKTGSGTERRMLSMVRLMREPVMGLAYALTCKVETLGAVPRTTWVGYEGQFRGHEEEWAKANHEPVPFLVVRPTTEATGLTNVLPLPARQSWDPPLQNIEMTCESFRRSIQAAAGTSPLPTEAQRQNQKSGKALDRIESSGQKGSFHFVDHLDGMITRVGVMLDELIPHYDDTVGEVTIRNPDDQSSSQRINDPNDPESVMVDSEHQHDITLSVGPAKESERQDANEFADTIVGNEALLQTVGPQKAAELTALAIRLKDVGPIGDEMAEIISPKPPDEGAPPTPEQVRAMQQQIEQLQQQLQEATTAVQTDEAKQTAQVEIAKAKADADTAKASTEAQRASEESALKWSIAELQADTELEKVRMQEATKMAIAHAQLASKAMTVEADAAGADLDRSADAAEADAGRAHASSEAATAREAQAEGADADRAHAAEMAEAERVAAAQTAEGAGA